MSRVLQRSTLLICIAISPIAFTGCNQSGGNAATATSEDGHEGEDHEGESAGHDHSGWWCPEHGIPEEVCTRCNSTLIAQFKEKGDWCETHNRPDSNCFHCHPELEAKFAARYAAKYGEEPPTPTDP